TKGAVGRIPHRAAFRCASLSRRAGRQRHRTGTALRPRPIKTFGAGAELDPRGWLSVIRQLVAQGHLLPDPEGHGGLMFGENAEAILRGTREVRLRRDAGRERGSRRKPATAADRTLDAAAEALWTA